MIVQHRARLRLNRDAALPFHVEFVENLLVAARLDGAGELEEPVAHCQW